MNFKEKNSKKDIRKGITSALACMIIFAVPNNVMAAEKFDPAFYASTYADVANTLGTDVNALYNHYITCGQNEGRLPYAGAIGGAEVDGIADTMATVTETYQNTTSSIVPLEQLANYKSIKKNMTNEEFQAAYNEALAIVQPLVGLSKEEQLRKISSALRSRFDNGMSYSMSTSHYNDPYGYLILGSASCAGSTRATGLCLNMLGYSYEHVNENQWSHQWCRVNMGDSYWICDPFGLYVGPEPGAYMHPALMY